MRKTILISTPILPDLAELCTSIGIIEHGKMVISGTVEEIMQKVSNKKTLRIKVLGDMEPAVKLLKEQPTVSGVSVHNDYIDADFEGTKETMVEILKTAVANGIPVVSFTDTDRNLESVFMQLITTGGENDAN
jgi:ABC-2 type transport system ATP-binding protein